jgi:hypothetical protein
MLIAEDLLLLVTDDDSGKLAANDLQVDLALGGATLVELSLGHKVDVTSDRDAGRSGRLVVRDPTPTGDTVLDAALAVVDEHQGKKPSAVIRPLSKKLRNTLYQRLAANGIVRAEHHTILGIFPTHRWPAQDARHETEVRRQVTEALANGTTPDQRTAALIALLHALRCEHKIVDPHQHGITKAELRDRADQIARSDWASEAVRKAIDELIAAIAVSSASAAVPRN